MQDYQKRRVHDFCDWLDTIPPHPPYHTRPGFKMLWGDLTPEMLAAAQAEMRRRAASDFAEADALQADAAANDG